MIGAEILLVSKKEGRKANERKVKKDGTRLILQLENYKSSGKTTKRTEFANSTRTGFSEELLAHGLCKRSL